MAKKYKKGQTVKRLITALLMIENEQSFYYRHKYMHYKFIEHWSIVQLRNAIKYGHLFRVQRMPKEVT